MQPTRVLQALRYRRLRLTTKDVNKGYYKGTRTGSMGRHTKHGGYIIDWNKVRTYVCPSLEGFKVRFSSSPGIATRDEEQKLQLAMMMMVDGCVGPAHPVRDPQYAPHVWPVRGEQARAQGSCDVSCAVEG
jgi:hypothetical protein